MSEKALEDIIAAEGKLIFPVSGGGMYPAILPHDRLAVEKAARPLTVNDILLYKQKNGEYAPARIIAVKKNRYTLKADSSDVCEKGVPDSRIVGAVTAILRGGITIPFEKLGAHRRQAAADMIRLLTCAVNEEKPDPERCARMDLTEIFRLSRLHLLASAVSFALEQSVQLPHAFEQAQKKAIRKLALFEIERTVILKELAAAGIWYLPLKGIILKNAYPKEAMREMTDNDILVDASRAADVRTIMKRLGYRCESFGDYHHDVYSKPPTLEFEIHRALFGDNVPAEIIGYYSSIDSKLIKDGFARRMTDEDFYLYFLCHTYKHYIHGGAGLRALLDVFVYLRAHPDLDRSYLSAELDKLKLAPFESSLRSLAQKVFTGAPLSDSDREALDYLIGSGASGTAENAQRNYFLNALENDDSKGSKRRYLLRRIFISGDTLEKQYPFVAKHKVLYPFLLIYRPVKGAVTRPKQIIEEYGKIKKFKIDDR